MRALATRTHHSRPPWGSVPTQRCPPIGAIAHPGADCDRVLLVLAVAGDARFASRGAQARA